MKLYIILVVVFLFIKCDGNYNISQIPIDEIQKIIITKDYRNEENKYLENIILDRNEIQKIVNILNKRKRYLSIFMSNYKIEIVYKNNSRDFIGLQNAIKDSIGTYKIDDDYFLKKYIN